jgi:hypothetical protein
MRKIIVLLILLVLTCLMSGQDMTNGGQVLPNTASWTKCDAKRRESTGKESQQGITSLVWNRKSVLTHTALVISTMYDVEVTHQGIAHHNCSEANPLVPARPSRLQLYRLSLTPVATLIFAQWLMAKRGKQLPQFLEYMEVAATAGHLAAGTVGLGRCW